MAVAADAFFGAPTRALDVAGVTGTNGKTTTTFLLRSILEAAGRAPGLVGTVDWIVGGGRAPAPHTTPEAIDLQRLFREMLDAGDEAVAIEASSHGSHFRRLDRVRFDALVFTNLTQDHLDLHGDMEEYFQAKRRLFTGVAPPPAAVNVGDPYGRRLADELAGRAPRAARHVRAAAGGRGARRGARARRRAASRFTAAGIALETPLLGIFNVENVLGAVAAGAPARRRRRRDRGGRRGGDGRPGPVRGGRRGSGVRRGRRLRAHARRARRRCSTPRASSATGRLTVVFGAGGDRDRTSARDGTGRRRSAPTA